MKFWNVTGYVLKGVYSIYMRSKYPSKCKNLQNVTSLFEILHSIFSKFLVQILTACFTTSAVVKLILVAVIQTTHS